MDKKILQKFLRLIGIAMVGFALIAGCSGNPSGMNDDGGGGGNGDPPPTQDPDPTFTNVRQIINSSCGGSACHLSAPFQSGVNLSSYSNVMESVGDQYGTEIVQPGDAAGSPMVDKINPNPQFGSRMPEGGPFLDQEEIDLIVEWINNGAQNN